MFIEKNNLFPNYRPLRCPKCNKDLLIDPTKGYMVYVKNKSRGGKVKVIDFFWSCKGLCFQSLSASKGNDVLISKEEIADIVIPYNYLNWMLANLHLIHSSFIEYETTPFSNMKFFLSRIAQLSLRSQENEEINRINDWK